MQISRFDSEAYPIDQRDSAWVDLLSKLHLKVQALPDGADRRTRYTNAVARGEDDGLFLARLIVPAQDIAPLPARNRLPAMVLPLDEGLGITNGETRMEVPPGHLVMMPANPGWHISLPRPQRIVVGLVSAEILQGRRPTWLPLPEPRRLAPEGLSAIFIRAVETASAEMERLSVSEWRALEQTLANLFLMLPVAGDPGQGQSASNLALFNRVTMAVERALHDPALNAGALAQMEGISERYLQKLFEQTGDSFSHYLRERRLQRAESLLTGPGGVRLSVTDVAYHCGFGDAANFNRQFKERFGLPPGAYRTEQAVQASEEPEVEQRGWPVVALTSKKHQGRSLRAPGATPPPEAAHPAQPGSGVHHLPASARTVHWGYFSRALPAVLEIRSGDQVVVETLSQHASDAPELMIHGDASAEDVFHWDATRKNVDRRGAGPMDASVFGRGAGEGFGVHICTGPIHVAGAERGDVIEVRIDDIAHRPSQAPGYQGRCFGSNVAAWWGYHYNDLLKDPKPREVITIYEIFSEKGYAESLFSYPWDGQVDPFGTLHRTYDYPGVPVDPATVARKAAGERRLRVPLRPHFGVIALAPKEAELVDSVPPAYFGGNLDNWRLGRGASVYLPVSVPGGLLSIGDPHAAQGDGELAGTAIESSMTGRFTVTLHKQGGRFPDLSYPLIETPTEWILTGFSHPNYLAEFGAKSQGEVYATSSLDLAMKDAFRKARRFLMSEQGLTEDEAISILSAAVDFGVTQVVDGNWSIHAIIPKSIFATAARS